MPYFRSRGLLDESISFRLEKASAPQTCSAIPEGSRRRAWRSLFISDSTTIA